MNGARIMAGPNDANRFPAAELPAPASVLTEHADAIRTLGRRVIADAIEIGARLTECKRICGHGGWLLWLDREFGWTEMTATRFINLYEMSKSNKLLDLDLPLSGLYLLAAPSTPPEARDAIIARAEAGEKMSVVEVTEKIAEAKGRRQPRNMALAPIYRAEMLGEAVMAKIEGTTLDTARELDALIYLNRGASAGEHTPEVERLVEDACAGKNVSAIEFKKNGGSPPRDDIRSESAGETEDPADTGGELTVLIESLRRILTGVNRPAWLKLLPARGQKRARKLVENLTDNLYDLIDLRQAAAKAAHSENRPKKPARLKLVGGTGAS
jgi:Protein of unknown function (DUF3102)